MVEELHRLLGAAGVPGPYVLVGHSFGGLLVRLYAARYPQEVAGLVLVDSAHEQQHRRAPAEIRELAPQFEEQARQQFEGLKALIVSGSLDPAMLPVPPQLPATAAETFRALVASGPKHVETLLAEQQAVQVIHSELAAASARKVSAAAGGSPGGIGSMPTSSDPLMISALRPSSCCRPCSSNCGTSSRISLGARRYCCSWAESTRTRPATSWG